MKRMECYECPNCGHVSPYKNRQERMEVQRYAENRRQRILRSHPGAREISVDGSLWTEWVDKNGNIIKGL